MGGPGGHPSDPPNTKGRSPGEAAFNQSGVVESLLCAGTARRGAFDLLRHRQQAFALQLLALQLAGAAHGFRLLAGLFSDGFS